jgi:hypothetical protein
MSYAQRRNSYTCYIVHLGIILILVLGIYSGLSARVRTVYLFSLCVVSLLSSSFTANALDIFIKLSSAYDSLITHSLMLCVTAHISNSELGCPD